MTITPAALTAFSAQLLQAAGFTADEARQTAQSLVLSNMMGHDSHGVMRVAEYSRALKQNEVASNVSLSVLRETAHSCHADAQRGLGQVMMPDFLDRLLDKAQTQPCVTGAMQQCGHVGRLGEWVDRIGESGMAGMVAVNDNGALHFVAAPGGIEGRTSTNPVAFAIPLKDGAVFSIDMATSAIAIGKVRLAWLGGDSCPVGSLQDHKGAPTNDPATMFEDPKGAMLPFGGAQSYKAFGLSMMIDLLCAGLSGGFAPPAPKEAEATNNIVVSVWNPAFFAGLDHMQEQAALYCDFIRQSTPIDPRSPVRLPGDRAKDTYKQQAQKGITLDAGTIKTLAKSAALYDITLPDALHGDDGKV